MIMHFKIISSQIIIFLTFVIGFFLNETKAEIIVIDGIYMIVNSQMITRSEAKDLVINMKSNSNYSEYTTTQINKKLLKNILQELLLLDRANALKINPNTNEIENRLEKLKKDKPKLLDYFSENDLKKQISRDIKKHRVISREVESKIHLESSEIEFFCKQQIKKNRKIGLSQILLQGSENEVREKVESIMKDFNDGVNFEELAKLNSDDSKAKDTGGRLGIFKTDDLLPEIAKVTNELEPGKISNVIKTDLGYHLIYIFEEIFPEGINCKKLKPDQKEQFSNSLFSEKRNSLLHKYMDDLLACANIKIKDPGISGLPSLDFLPTLEKRKINCQDRRIMVLPQKKKKNKSNRKPNI